VVVYVDVSSEVTPSASENQGTYYTLAVWVFRL
jgi:hypothetical protein